ncbi:MAG: putative sulfate/molybdate transporter [bacterium]
MKENNKKTFLTELSGALGDIPTLLPIYVSLIAINGLNATVSLLMVGLVYIIAGFYYKLPMPVQPLKALAAIAIANSLSPSLIYAAGILMGIILLLLAITGLTRLLTCLFSPPIIKGIQLGIGLMLVNTSWKMITKSIISEGSCGLSGGIPFQLLMIFGGLVIISIFLWNKGFPATIAILIWGIGLNLLTRGMEHSAIQMFNMPEFSLSIPKIDDFINAFFLLVIPQLPLTLGNSIISTTDVARKYFGQQARRVTETSLCLGLGTANMVIGCLGECLFVMVQVV